MLRDRIPDEYLELFGKANGGDGFLGDNCLQLWSAEHVVKRTNLNRELWMHEGTEHLVFIGGDGEEEHLRAGTDDIDVPAASHPC